MMAIAGDAEYNFRRMMGRGETGVIRLRRWCWLLLLCPGLCLADAGAVAPAKRQSWAEWFAQQSAQQQRDETPTADPKDAKDADGKSSRMSPEERRQLRHDVRDAGRDIYPRRAQGKSPRNQRNQQKFRRNHSQTQN